VNVALENGAWQLCWRINGRRQSISDIEVGGVTGHGQIEVNARAGNDETISDEERKMVTFGTPAKIYFGNETKWRQMIFVKQ
jgi:hypothetical protein